LGQTEELGQKPEERCFEAILHWIKLVFKQWSNFLP